MDKYILAIDAGTTSSRAILFDKDANPVEISQYEFNQFFPKEGWVEHDPTEIWNTQLKAIKEVIKKSKIDPKNIDSIELQIKERQQLFGIKIMVNQFIMQLYGKIEGLQAFVIS